MMDTTKYNNLISQILYARGLDEERPNMVGVIQTREGWLVCTDGHRAAVAWMPDELRRPAADRLFEVAPKLKKKEMGPVLNKLAAAVADALDEERHNVSDLAPPRVQDVLMPKFPAHHSIAQVNKAELVAALQKMEAAQKERAVREADAHEVACLKLKRARIEAEIAWRESAVASGRDHADTVKLKAAFDKAIEAAKVEPREPGLAGMQMAIFDGGLRMMFKAMFDEVYVGPIGNVIEPAKSPDWIGVNATYMLEAVSNLPGDVIYVGVPNDKYAPFRLAPTVDGPDHAIVMPMRI